MLRKTQYVFSFVLLAMIGLLAACGTPYQYTGTFLEPPKATQDWTLTDQHGQPFKLSDQRGKLLVLYFGYTNCPDYCPATLADWKMMKQQLGADADKVRFVLITVDPERDTEQVLNDYIAKFDESFVGLRPTQEQLMTISREYGVGMDTLLAAKAHNHGVDAINRHGSYIYVLDTDGQLRLLFRPDAIHQQMTNDLRHLLDS